MMSLFTFISYTCKEPIQLQLYSSELIFVPRVGTSTNARTKVFSVAVPTFWNMFSLSYSCVLFRHGVRYMSGNIVFW